MSQHRSVGLSGIRTLGPTGFERRYFVNVKSPTPDTMICWTLMTMKCNLTQQNTAKFISVRMKVGVFTIIGNYIMKKTSTIIAATIIMLAIAPQSAQAARINQSPIMNPPVFELSKRCMRDYNKCLGFVGSLCKRLLKRNKGGGSMRNCRERKERRCSGRLNRCDSQRG